MNYFNSMQFTGTRAITTWLILCMGVISANAGELVYTPTNPSFGGNPNNASGLLAVANAQNDYKAPKAVVSDLDKFTAAIQTAVLNRLKKDAIDTLLPTEGDLVFDKSVTYGNFEFTLKKGTDGSVILITVDTLNGGESKVEIGSSSSTGQ
jgi:curli production assembly/transport component CsgF